MFKFFTKALNDERGFTLVELIVVIAIIAVLALIAVPRFGGFTESAKIEADKASAKTIENAITMYIAQGNLVSNDIASKDGVAWVTTTEGKVTVPKEKELVDLLGAEIEAPQEDDMTTWKVFVDENGDVTVESSGS